MFHPLKVASSILTSSVALWRGTAAFRPAAEQPRLPLALYEFEGCPYCRMLRSALTELDLDVMIYPCPKSGRRFRPRAITLGGKAQFPFLHDPNTGARLYESAEIAAYLARTYGGHLRGESPMLRELSLAGSMAASALRAHRGMRTRPSRAPEQPLVLYSFEASPYSRLVREVLCELELPYLLRNTGKARWSDMGPPAMRDKLFKGPKASSRNRAVLFERTGHVQVPYLIDPNTGVEMFESADIIRYLNHTYGD